MGMVILLGALLGETPQALQPVRLRAGECELGGHGLLPGSLCIGCLSLLALLLLISSGGG